MLEKDRFTTLWSRNSELKNDSSKIWSDIVNHYCEKHRYYHNTSHIQHCLAQLDLINDITDQDRDAIELAIWFHDIIYGNDNCNYEQLSAEYFSGTAKNILPAQTISRVSQFIIATSHTNIPEDIAEKYMLDIDLSSFGSSWELYLIDSDNLRKEDIESTDSDYYTNKKIFLLYLITRERIFFSNFFYQLYEKNARNNIAAYLEQINLKLQT
jgi:predicted metal-dependent HD superfamily phosphohydrolase